MNDKITTVKKRTGLGRGLSALLDEQSTVESNMLSHQHRPGISEIAVELIETNPYQPRTHFEQEALQELAESIRVQGIIQPITVRQLAEGQFQLISGERRLQASKLAGLTHIPAYVRTANDQQMLEMALIENIQRENLNAIEIALKQEELGDRVGKKRSTVNNYLRLLKLPTEIQAAIRDGQLSMGHARALVNVEHIDDQLNIYRRIVAEELSVRKVEELVRNLAGANSKPVAPRVQPASLSPDQLELNNLQGRLTSHFGSRVNIKSDDGQRGDIRISFVSPQDLNRILEMLNL
jgi:ParB family transcriptional regulator, chromosome partitioning protein